MKKYEPSKENQENNLSNSSKSSGFFYSSSSFVSNPNSLGRSGSGQAPRQSQIGLFQNFLQGLSTNTGNSGNADLSSTLNFSSCTENMIQSLFRIVQQQNATLQNLSEKVYQITEKTVELTEKYNSIQEESKVQVKRESKQILPEKQIKGEVQSIPRLKFAGEQVNGEQLIQILFGKKEYEYNLQLKENLLLPIYRQRNFNLKIQLIDQEGIVVKNSNKIPMSLAIYTCQNPPKFLQKNTSGQKMLKGFTEQILQNGQCLFQKIQIRQVTSHYRQGWIYVVVIPCMTPLGSEKSDSFIDFKQIKPLVINNIVVKAKKPKKNQNIIEDQSQLKEDGQLKNDEEFEEKSK